MHIERHPLGAPAGGEGPPWGGGGPRQGEGGGAPAGGAAMRRNAITQVVHGDVRGVPWQPHGSNGAGQSNQSIANAKLNGPTLSISSKNS